MTTTAQNTQNTQLGKANAALMKLSGNVSSDDRQAAMEKLDIKARSTIWQYLKGQGKDLDTAVALLEFFRERIAKRDQVIAA